MTYDSLFEEVLAEYHDRIKAEHELMKALPMKEGMKRRDEFLLSVGEDAAIFLNTLAKSAKSKTILEIGTSYGYSTLWLAEAARKNKGIVITLENDKKKAAYAQKKLTAAGLSEYVEFRIGDALESLQNATETFDFVLVDIWKELYVPCFDLFYPKLNNGAWVLGDNMIFPSHHQKDTEEYQKRVHESGTFTSILLPIGSGIEVSQFNKN